MSAAQELTAALGGRWRGTHGEARCLAHDDRDPSLTIRDGDTAPLLVCFAGCERAAIIDALRARGLWAGRSRDWLSHRRPATRQPTPPSPEEQRNRASALRIWQECQPAADSVVETYLRGRAIKLPIPPTIRYHCGLKHAGVGLILPALVAAVQAPDRSVIAIQRIFLQPTGRGKAVLNRPKLSLGSLHDGAVRLAAAGPVLGIAEGIETALSAMQIFNIPTWASLGARRMKAVALPPEVARVIIFGDRGEEGERQTREAADEFSRQGRHVDGRFPPDGDWNDELQRRQWAV